MRSFIASTVTFVAALATPLPTDLEWGNSNKDIILTPKHKSADAPTKLLVMIPGADVATEYYTKTAEAIQQAA